MKMLLTGLAKGESPSRKVLFHSFQLRVHWVDFPDSSFDARQPRLSICDTRS